MFPDPLPARVNHRKLASEKRKLEGTLPLATFTRLTESLQSDEGDVSAKLEFRKARKHATILVGNVSATVSLICQNCLLPMPYELTASLRHYIVNSEDALWKLDEEDDGIISEEDLVPVVDLLEDELILALPMVSKHASARCGVEGYEPDVLDETETDISAETYKPFAGLAELKDEITGASNGRSEK
jgi:uncharacterized protein